MYLPREPSLSYPKKTKNPNPSPIGNKFGFFLFDGRGFLASRASEKAPQGLFPPPDYSAGRCCSNPPLKAKLQILCKTKIQCISTLDLLVGAGSSQAAHLKKPRRGFFPPPDYSAGRCCSNPPLKAKLQILCKTKIQCISTLDLLVERSNPNPNHCPLGHLWRRFHRK